MRHLHSHWTSLFTSCLPFLGRSLSQSVLEVASQLSKNLESLACFYDAAAAADDEDQQEDASSDRNCAFGQIPADYVVTQMEALTMVYHYCLLDSGSAQAGATAAQATPASAGLQQGSSLQQQQQNEILSNLLHVFLSNTDSKNLTANSVNAPASVDTLAIARKILLSTLPRLVNTVAILWKAVVNNK